MLQKNRPTAPSLASDYYSQIVSVGKLYDKWDYNNDPKFSIKHMRSVMGDGPDIEMTSSMVYEGTVNKEYLDQLIHQRLPSNVTYHPGQDLAALNLLSWSKINFSDGKGVRVGNKFYPKDNPALIGDVVRKKTEFVNSNRIDHTQKIYDARIGFYSSMRPGVDSLLLNVNITPDWNLQLWINRRWNSLPVQEHVTNFRSPAKEHHELIGLQVLFEGTDQKHTIYGVSHNNVSRQLFADGENRTSVFNHMKNSKSTNIVHFCIIT